MRLKLIFVSVVMMIFASPVLAQSYRAPGIERDPNNNINARHSVLGPIAPRMDKQQVKIRKHYLDIGLITVVSVGDEIIATQFNPKITAKDKSYREIATVQTVTVTKVYSDQNIIVYDVSNNGTYLYSIVYNRAKKTAMIVNG